MNTENLTEQEIVAYLDIISNIEARAIMSKNNTLLELAQRDKVKLCRALTPFKTGRK